MWREHPATGPQSPHLPAPLRRPTPPPPPPAAETPTGNTHPTTPPAGPRPPPPPPRHAAEPPMGNTDPTTPAAGPLTRPRTGWASLKDLNKYQWFVFVVAAIAWMADCMDQQLFNLARVMSLSDLLGKP